MSERIPQVPMLVIIRENESPFSSFLSELRILHPTRDPSLISAYGATNTRKLSLLLHGENSEQSREAPRVKTIFLRTRTAKQSPAP